MPALLILLAIVIAWMFLTFKARQRTRNCRWREDRNKDTPEGRYFICTHCGADTFCEGGQPPQICLSSSLN